MAPKSKSAVLKAGSLILDSKNTRIPADRRSDDQRHLLHQLVEHEDIRGLASSIVKLGLFPNERLVVVASGRRYVVLEGNRRLAAIKLLLSPELAPDAASVRFFRKLSDKTDVGALGKLEAAIVQSRIAAAPIIAALHTREAKKRWSPLQQARFYRELVDEGQTPAEVAEDLGISLGQVSGYLRAEKLYRVGLTLDYTDDVRRAIEDSRFHLTTLERFLESKIGRDFLGIDLDDAEGFTGVVHPDRFKAVLAHVTEEVATKPGLTRKINDEKGFAAYISEAEKKIEKTKVRGSFSPDSLLTDNSVVPAVIAADKEKVKSSRSEKPSSSVVPKGFTCRSKHERVRAIFDELKAISISGQRNSTGVMLRVLLDIALWSFFKDVGHVKAVLAHYDSNGKKRGYNPEWTPSLRDLISYAVENHLFPAMTPDGYKAVRSLASKDASYFITIDGFNEFTHNPSVTPTEGDLRALWQRAEPMLAIILN
jgi:hypothetical protein